MNRTKQFSIRWLLLLILVAALLAAIVRSLLIVDVVESHISVAVFGKTKYDRPAAHLDFIKSLNQRFSAVDPPDWAEGKPISGEFDWQPTRADWFIVDDNQTCYVHVASASDGMAIDVWVHRQVFRHRLGDDKTPNAKTEFAISIANEIHNWWFEWCFDNIPR